MSAEKRKVSTDALETLGTIIDSSAARDAIHLAVEPIVAGEVLEAGDHIGIVNGVAVKNAPKKLGIVDPFIRGVVNKGTMFWLVVYPRQITSLRHVWSHPDFAETARYHEETTEHHQQQHKEVMERDSTEYDGIIDAYRSQEWIQRFADRIPLKYDTLMEGAEMYLMHGDRLNFGSLLEGEFVPDEFWDHYEIVTKSKIEEENRGNFFSCSC